MKPNSAAKKITMLALYLGLFTVGAQAQSDDVVKINSGLVNVFFSALAGSFS